MFFFDVIALICSLILLYLATKQVDRDKNPKIPKYVDYVLLAITGIPAAFILFTAILHLLN